MTDNQREASRANGAKSHGPATEEGRRRSSMNALKHGLSSATQIVLKNEPRAEFDLLRQGYLDRFQPADPVELDLIEQAVAASWRLRRVWTVESELIEDSIHQVTPRLKQKWSPNQVPEPTRTCEGMRYIMSNPTGFANNLGRYESHQSRLYRRALQDLIKIRQLKPPASPPIEEPEQPHLDSVPDPQPAQPPSAPDPQPAQPQATLPKLLSVLCVLFCILCAAPGSFCNDNLHPVLHPARVCFVNLQWGRPSYFVACLPGHVREERRLSS